MCGMKRPRLRSWILGILPILAASRVAGQATLSDTFDTRPAGSTDLSALSPGGLSWTQIMGAVRVDNFSAQPTATGSRALIWPRVNGTPTDTLVTANQITDWNSFTMEFGWSSKYVRKTAGILLLYKDPDNFYFLRLPSLTDGQLIRRQNGVETVLTSGDIDPPDVGDTVVTSYRIEVQAQSGGIQFRADRGADGSSELEYTDADSAALSMFSAGGRIGLRCLADNGAYHLVYLDRVTATGQHVDIVPAAPVPTNTPTQTASPTPTPVPTEESLIEADYGRVTAVQDLAASPSQNPGGFRMVLTAPDGNLDLAGMQAAAAYDIRYSASPINTEADFLAAAKLPNIPDPWPGGLRQTIDCYTLPAGTLHFRLKVIGTNTSGLSNAVSTSASPGSASWVIPANGKVGIDLKVAGVEHKDFVYETLFYDRAIDDHGVLYLRDDVQLSLSHNSKNSKPAGLWTGGQAGITPNTSADPNSLAGGQGNIRYRFDSDGLRMGSTKQAYVVNGVCYGNNTYLDHRMFKPYSAPFTAKSYYDAVDARGFAAAADRVGQNSGPGMDDNFHRGYVHPESGDEWHELAYWDDDLAWLNNKERHCQASDGRMVWVVLNPKTPAFQFSAGSGGRFFTTRPRAYFQGKVVPQTTSFSGEVALRLTNLSPFSEPVQYRFSGGAWTDYSGPLELSSITLPAGAPVDFEARIGVTGPVAKRTLVREPANPSLGETHPILMFRPEEKAILWDKIRTNPALATEYKKLKANGNQIKALMGRNYEADERLRFLLPAGQALSAAFAYALEGSGTLLDSTYTGAQVAAKAFRTLLAVLSGYDSLGDETQAGQWAGPNGELTLEWWDRGVSTMYAHMAYDLIAGAPGIHPIDEIKLREAFAQECALKMRFIAEIRGNWNLRSSAGLLCAAYSMPSFLSPVFGGALNNPYEGSPFNPGISWARYVEDSQLPIGGTGQPKMRSTLWDTTWEDGVHKESSSYDVGDRQFLSYILNIFANCHPGENLMEAHPRFRRAYEWSLRTRFPWNRNHQSYGQARYILAQDFHLLMNPKFENYLDMGALQWHYDHHSPALGLNPNSLEPIPFVLVWHDPDYAPSPPFDTGTHASRNNMIFQEDFTAPNTVQLLVLGRETSWEPHEAHRKDDSTSIFLNAFGERFLTNSDEPSDWLRSNAESQNVILVDDTTPGPVNTIMAQGPSRATVATMHGNLVTPYIDYGVISTLLNSEKDSSYYRNKAQLDRHVFFPDHRFFVILDDMEAPD